MAPARCLRCLGRRPTESLRGAPARQQRCPDAGPCRAFDPATPPSYAAETVRTLPNGHVVELPGLGHVVTLTPCGIRDVFLVDPPPRWTGHVVEALPPATFATDIASVPGLPYLLDGLFGQVQPFDRPDLDSCC